MNDQKPKFATVNSFVEEYLVGIYQRQVTDTSDTVWCDQWWRHGEAAARLTAVWRAWERWHRDERGGLSYWLVQHADRHMKQLFDPRGPFKYCSVRNGHRGVLGPLPTEAPPNAVLAELTPERHDDWWYPTLVDFVDGYLGQVYQRQVTDLSDTAWCPRWWQHREAVVRIESLWTAHEFARNDRSDGLSEWFLEHADPQMKQLLDPRGPFKYCTVRGGHQSKVSPLPVTTEPPGLFAEPDPVPER
ncbi:DUF4913 domain-containing protein [Nocardia sp. NBC_01377]|uniref:DUF4913 domain-containing protein n=1 Tax=Nocardia sp. NBC_01377 TaxID=2903595 RepID=UPI00325178B2